MIIIISLNGFIMFSADAHDPLFEDSNTASTPEISHSVSPAASRQVHLIRLPFIFYVVVSVCVCVCVCVRVRACVCVFHFSIIFVVLDYRDGANSSSKQAIVAVNLYLLTFFSAK